MAGRKFTREAVDAFLESAGPSLQKLVMELDKLFNFTVGCEVITLADVLQSCPPKMEENIFAIVDALGNKRCGEALAGVRDMLAAKEPPLRILSMISRQFRLLLQARELMGRGCTAREIQGRLNVHPYVCQKITAQCDNFDYDRLVDAIGSLLELDVSVKTGRQEFYPALETYLLKLCT
ncbi:MAG: DNA polymerase III subunit delta [Pelotomaculum sp. PtaU1.Bin035]|nr:MAG: DNA polymerase III subunit delta [Pelotomaculum sp. PtaU1.Bin035]